MRPGLSIQWGIYASDGGIESRSFFDGYVSHCMHDEINAIEKNG